MEPYSLFSRACPISFIIHKENLEGTEHIKVESTFTDANLITPQKRLNQFL